jgi:hypothetical protein
MTCKFVSFSIFRKPFGLRYIGCLEIYIYRWGSLPTFNKFDKLIFNLKRKKNRCQRLKKKKKNHRRQQLKAS